MPYMSGTTWKPVLHDDSTSPILGYAYNIMHDTDDNSNSTIYSVGHSNRGAIRNIIRTNDNGKTWQQCMTYNSEGDNSFFFDTALFDARYGYMISKTLSIGISMVVAPALIYPKLTIHKKLHIITSMASSSTRAPLRVLQ